MSKPRILFADDSVTIQQVFEFAFENEEIEIALASDGQEAFEKAKELVPDMVIADVNMPQVDGFELCRLIRDDPALSSIPVYLLSSSLEEFDEERAQTAGADGNFNKPFKSEEMLEKVRKVIAEIPKPGSDRSDEYTFDEIDVSIDSILEGIEKAVKKEDTTHDPRLDEIESAVEEALASSHLLDLGAEAKVERGPDEEEELAVEVISGEEISLDTNFEDMEKLGAELDSMTETEIETAGDAAPDEPAPPEAIDSSIEDDEKDEPETGEEQGIDANHTEETEIEEDIEIEINPIPDSQIIENVKAKVEEELGKAAMQTFGDHKGEGLDETINKAIGEAVAEKIKSIEIEKLLASLVKSAITDLKPEMFAMLKKVAQDMTLEVAEDMVKQTIDQIKNEK